MRSDILERKGISINPVGLVQTFGVDKFFKHRHKSV